MSILTENATTAPVRRRLLLHQGKLYEPVNTRFYSGWAEVRDAEIITAEPKNIWALAPISSELWEAIVSFMRWSQATFRSEALITLFYNTAENRWDAWPFAQHPSGMTVRYDRDHPSFATDRARFGRDWVEMGSVHHHCTTSAFQSATDTADEMNRDGLHITLGFMEREDLDLHARQVFDGVMSTDVSLRHWIKPPEWVNNIPFAGMRNEASLKWVKGCASDLKNPCFPPEWKDRVIPFTQAPVGGIGGTARSDASRSVKEYIKSTPAGRFNPNGKFEERCIKSARKILEDLKMDASDAYVLACVPDTTMLDDEGRMNRNRLVRALASVNVPWIYADDVFDYLFMEQQTAEASVTVEPGSKQLKLVKLDEQQESNHVHGYGGFD